MSTAARGRLFLVPTWLSEDSPVEAAIPAAALARIRALNDFVVEEAKSARRFIAACGHPVALRELRLAILNEHTAPREVPALLQPAREGRDLGLLSEAGLPAVADPGARLVAAAHAEGLAVVPLAGPSSILLALAASGLEGQRFRFVGYLPAKGPERATVIAELERRSARDRETQIFIETPYRNDALLEEVLKTCGPATRLAVAADLTGAAGWVRMAAIGEWRKTPRAPGRVPAVFLLLAGGH
jgi:16S rRNA (cytidine1402-2'-O)-methyltransferase